MVVVAITASNRAAAVHRWLPPVGPLAKAAARQRSSVATLTPTSRETTSIAELSGGNNRATIRPLYAAPYLANFPKPKPSGSRSYPSGNFSDKEGRRVGPICLHHVLGARSEWTPRRRHH